MKKNTEKKINWKKVVIVGGVFGLGALAGAFGDRKLLDYLIKTEGVGVSINKNDVYTEFGKPFIKLIIRCEKAGLTIPADVSRDFVEDTLDMIDGKPFNLERFFT